MKRGCGCLTVALTLSLAIASLWAMAPDVALRLLRSPLP